MDVFTVVFGVLSVTTCLYVVGHSFIDSFFDRKEEMMRRIIENERGKN